MLHSHRAPPEQRSPTSHVLRTGLLAGTLAAAATLGALVGFGVRDGTPARPLNAVARVVIGARADGVWGFDPVITLVGIFVHVTFVLACGVVFATLVKGRRGWPLAGAALAFALALLGVDVLLLTPRLHVGLADTLIAGQLIALDLLLAAALAVGMRLAHSGVWND